MIDILEIFRPTLSTLFPVPHLPYVWKLTISISKPEVNVAPWWRTTYGGGSDYPEARKLIGSVWDADDEYNEKTALEDCIAEEKSFYYDVSSDPQVLYIHYEHDIVPLTDDFPTYTGEGQGYSNADGVYIDDVFYAPLIKETIPYKIGVDPIDIGLAKTLSGNVALDNSSGDFDNGESWYGAKAKGYKYSVDDGKIPSFYGNVKNESFSFENYTIQVIDSRDFDDVKMILDKWDTTWLDAGHSKIGKPIPMGFGKCLGVEGVNIINPTAGYKKFKGVAECLTVDAAYVLDDEVWSSVTVYNSSTDGSFELANADVLDADSKLLKVKVDYTCDYENLADRIVYLNLTYKGITYDTTNYNTDLWEYEKVTFSECGGLIEKDTNLLKYIGEMQAAQKWSFFYWRDQQGRRSIKMDNPNRSPRYSILAEDIMNYDRPNDRDNENFATSVEVLYSYDYSDKTYLSYVNDDYRDSVFKIYRKYQDRKGDEGLKTQITNEADAIDLSKIKMEDWQAPHDTFTIWVRRSAFPDIEILDILDVDMAIPEDKRLPGSGRIYFGEQRVKVIEIAYDENDFIQMQVRTQSFSAVIAGIGGYMSVVTVNHIRIDDNTTVLPTTENQAYLVTNVDSSQHTADYGGNTLTLEADETGMVLYDGTDWHLLAIWSDTGVNVVTQAWVQAQGYVTNALPPIGKIVFQQPFEDTPAALYSGTTWTNVSEKAWGYELSVSGWVARADVHSWDDTDYVPTDVVSGGTYNGETVNTVFNPEGKFQAIEGTRESGVTAKAFETGFEADAMQRITGVLQNGTDVGLNKNDSSLSGVFSADTELANGAAQSSTNEWAIAFDSADSTSPNTAKTNDYETRPEYFTVRAWVRRT